MGTGQGEESPEKGKAGSGRRGAEGEGLRMGKNGNRGGEKGAAEKVKVAGEGLGKRARPIGDAAVGGSSKMRLRSTRSSGPDETAVEGKRVTRGMMKVVG